ncbi:glycoside hydrolase family 27 protein [Heterobasidion irregulare TC 32-1]|uniref:Alpha-galactosidase n=1 Tax=Heterobasidion irregulare (strain TC 32-1) TaxID=747525 RepID=W4K793_HETIT|nr:glycoside hydrolase family 27 protein [Heterobasidion irregulare TC 32-1]ETW80921.1 glycoside hydrolase family 27 protein [Heterobasidion irregulare TC 32-1]
MHRLESSLVALLSISGLAVPALTQSGAYGQCGGIGWSGATTCVSGNDYYSQCLQSTTSGTTVAASSTTVVGSLTTPPATGSASSTTSSSTASLTGIAATAPTVGPSKDVGKLPALGWNGWNAYGCEISADKVIAAANSFVSLGLKAAGYEYVNIDDCWAETSRDSNNKLVPDPTKFPNGLKDVADQVHALGLKIGIYSDAGTNTCAGFPGSLGHESTDAATWASWGIDYLKYDNCNVPGNWSDSSTPPGNDWYNSNSAIRYRQMTAALVAENTNPVQFDLCIWGTANVWEWGARVGHSWRMSGDSSATWSYITSIMTTNVQYLSSIDFYAHNDMDMMEIGNGDLTMEEQRSHFAVWAFMKSPILLGTNLSALSVDQISIITNSELLAFHQDATVGTPASPFTSSTSATTSPPQFYSGTSSKGTHVFIVNTGASLTTFTVNFADVPGLGSGSYRVHDMWASKDLGTFSGSWNVSIASHDTAAVLISSN